MAAKFGPKRCIGAAGIARRADPRPPPSKGFFPRRREWLARRAMFAYMLPARRVPAAQVVRLTNVRAHSSVGRAADS